MKAQQGSYESRLARAVASHQQMQLACVELSTANIKFYRPLDPDRGSKLMYKNQGSHHADLLLRYSDHHKIGATRMR